MKCSISPENIGFLKRKIAKDLLVINEKGQPWSVDAYMREIYDFILKATEGQKDNKEKALDAARLVPIFMERFKGIEPRIKSAIKLSTDTDANRLEELVDEFSTKKGLAAIESFLFPDEDVDITEVKKSAIHGTKEKIIDDSKKRDEDDFEMKPATSETTTGLETEGYNSTVKKDDPVSLLRYKVIRSIVNEIKSKGLYNADELGIFISSIKAVDVPDNAHTEKELSYRNNPENKNKIDKGVYWIITDKFGNPLLFKESKGKIIQSKNGSPVVIHMRALAGKTEKGNYKLSSPKSIQSSEELAVKVFGPKYTEENLNSIKKLRQEEVNRLGKIRAITRNGGSVVASINSNSSLGVIKDGVTAISEINDSSFKDGIFNPQTATENVGKIKEGFTYFKDANNADIQIDRPILTESQIEVLANIIAMPVTVNGRELTDQQKLDYLQSVYMGNPSTINWIKRKNEGIIFIVNKKRVNEYPSPEAARDEAIKVLKKAGGSSQGRMNINKSMLANNKQITLYEYVDGNLKSKTLDYKTYIKNNFKALTAVDNNGKLDLYNAYFTYDPINLDEKEILIEEKDRTVTPTVVEDPETALKPLEEKTLVVDKSNTDYYVELDLEGNVIQGTERLRQSLIKNKLKPFSAEPPKTNKGAIRGIIIDDLLRAYLAGEISNQEDFLRVYEESRSENLIYPISRDNVVQKDKPGKKIIFEEPLLESLQKIFKGYKDKLRDKYIIYSNLPTLWGELGGEKIAATIDLLIYNKESKTFTILDLKTSRGSRAKDYLRSDSSIDYMTSDQIQLSIYAELFKQRTGIVIDKVGIISIQVEERQGKFYIAKSEDFLFPFHGDYESIYEISEKLGQPITNSVVEYPSVQTEEIETEKENITQNNEQDDYDATNEGPTDNDIDDAVDDFLARNKQLDNKATRQQIKEAKEWYENHPLNEFIKYKAMFNIVNSKNWAEFTKNGIYLYKGSNFTDLYHEAWHGFSQMYMTEKQKKDLYKQVKNKNGSFTNYRGDKVSFKKATDLMIEEYLAEEFRKYVLSKGTKKIAQPEVKSIFQKIFEFLKNLFGFTTLDQVMIDPNSSKSVKDLFENLRVGEINDYTYSLKNHGMFSNLSSGFKSLDNTQERSFQDARLINETIDSLMSELIDKSNSRSISLNQGRKSLTNLFHKQESLSKAYDYVKLRLKQILAEEEKKDKNVQVINNIDLLKFTIDNFGTYSEYLENKKKNKQFPNITAYQPKGTIALHQSKTNFLNLDLKSDIVEGLDETDESKTIEGFDRPGNKLSVKQLASSEILYLLSSLYDKSYKNPDGIKNALGVKKLASFKKVWHHTVDLLESQRDSQKVYEMLIEESDSYPIYKQLIEKLGNPIDSVNTDSDFSIWAKFMETFNRTRISLVQLSMQREQDVELDTATYNLSIGEASSDWRKVRFDLINGFNVRPNDRFIKLDKDGANYLDVNEVIKRWGNTAASNPFAFFVDIGIDLDEQNLSLVEAVNNDSRMRSFAAATMSKLNLLNKKKIKVSNIIEDLERDFSRQIKSNKAKAQIGNIKSLSLLNLKHSDKYSSGMVSNAKNENQYEYSLQNSLSIISNAINNANSFEELMQTGFMSYLGNADYNNESSYIIKNPFTEIYEDENGQLVSTSKFLNSIFDFENGGKKRKNVVVNLNNLSGISLIDDNSTDLRFSEQTSKLDKNSKLIQDLHLLLSSNTAGASSELLRHSSKSTAYSSHLSIITTPGDDTHLYVDRKHFIESLYGDLGETNAINIILPYITAEANRAKRARAGELDNVPGYKKNALNLTIFESILGKTLSNKVLEYDDLNQELIENVDLKNEISEKIKKYFNNRAEDLRNAYRDLFYISPKLINEIKYQVDSTISDRELQDAIFKSFVYNKFIKDFEAMIVYYGDSAQYKTALDFFKRNSGIASTGRFPLNDKVAIMRVNNMTHEYAKSRGKTFPFDGTFKSAVVKDQKLDSLYYNTYYKAFEDYYKNKGLKGKKLKDAIEQELDPYLNMEVGDGQGWITFDSYRVYQDLLGRWSPNQEELYQKIIADPESVDIKTIVEFFPPKKVQYWGPLSKEGLPVKAFHKLSLLPLIPSVIKNTSLDDLHNNMVDQNINYLLYESGSKLGTITENDGQIDNIFLNEEEDTIKPFDPNQQYTPNIVYLDFLKDQLDIGTKFKNKVTFPTQLRKLIILGLFEKGLPADIINDISIDDWNKLSWGKKLEKSKYLNETVEYINLLNRLMTAKREELLDKAGWKKVGNTYKGSLKKLLEEVILPNLERADLSEAELKSLKTNSNGDLVFPLGMTMSASRIEKLLYSAVNRSLVRQKVKGDMEIQGSNSMFGNKDQIESYRNATEEEKEKYKGTIDLPSYTEGDGVTNAAKIKLALKGDFLKLLKLKDLDGNEIGDINTLNAMIKNDEWLNIGDHRKMITLVGVRIPVQALNSAEFFEVYEFLPEEAGNIIIPPAEIVAKSGADFDIDKLTMMQPSLVVKKGEVSINEEGVLGIENELMYKLKDILSMPNNFIRLIRPNSNLLGKEIADDLAIERDQESHIKILDAMFNVEMHDAFNLAGQALGIGAVDNTYNPLFNYAGMYLNKEYNIGEDVFETRILLDHNKMMVEDEEHVSLSNLVNTNGNDIDQVLEQLMNGWVDAEKDLWIFDLNARTELASTFLLLVQAGTPLKDAALFLNNPLIKEYIKEASIMTSPFALPLGRRDILSTDPRTDALRRIIRVHFQNYGTLPQGDTFLSKTAILKNAISARDTEFTKNELNKIQTKSENITDLQREAFLHFIELEMYANEVRKIKQGTRLDTNPVDTIYEAEELENNIDEIFIGGLIPERPVRDIMEFSPISSFQDVSEFQRELWKPFFPLRQNEILDTFLHDFVNRSEGKAAMRRVIGDDTNKNLFILNFKNAITDYIFQNHVINASINTKEYKGLDYDSKNHYKIEDVRMLKHGVFVKDGVMYVDRKRLRKIFEDQEFSKPSYKVQWSNDKIIGNSLLPASAFKARGYTNENSFLRFMFEKEHLRYTIPFDSVKNTEEFEERLKENMNIIDSIETKREVNESDEMYQQRMEYLTYDQIITNKALDNTLNMWKMFYSSESMANQWSRIKRKYGSELSQTYDLIEELIPDMRPGSNIKNLKLRDRLLDSDDVNTYYENLMELSDPGVEKVKDKEANNLISDFFNRLNFFAMIQSGIGTSNEFSMTRIIDQEKVMMSFLTAYDNFEMSNPLLYEIMLRFIDQNRIQNRGLNIRLKNYIVSPESANKELINDIDVMEKLESEEDIKLDKFKNNIFTYKNMSQININPNVTFITQRSSNKDNVFHLDVSKMTDENLDENAPLIDNMIQNIKNLISDDNSIALDKNGYFQNNFLKNPKTFVYLSKKLFELDGYINPNSILSGSLRAVMQKDEPITDQEINELKNKCFI